MNLNWIFGYRFIGMRSRYSSVDTSTHLSSRLQVSKVCIDPHESTLAFNVNIWIWDLTISLTDNRWCLKRGTQIKIIICIDDQF